MKHTHIVLIIVLAFVIVGAAGAVVLTARSALGFADRWMSDGWMADGWMSDGWMSHGRMSNVWMSREQRYALDDLSGFDSIRVEGKWEVDIEHSPEFFVELKVRTRKGDTKRVEVIDSTLVLDNDTAGYRGIGSLRHERYEARIGMPALSALTIEGLSEVDVEGFDEEKLSIIIDGLGDVEIEDSRAEMLTVRLDGMGNADLRGLKSVDALIDIAGAGVVRLTMDGGSIEGSIDGLGVIRYRGSVVDERIRIDGGGRIVAE